MLNYLDTDTSYIDVPEHNRIDTVVYGYEVDEACRRYQYEYSKYTTMMSISNGMYTTTINEGLTRANMINTLYDNELTSYHMVEAGYESMLSTGKDIIINIWEFIKKTIKGLIKFIKNIYDKIVKFISGLFKDTDKQEKDIKDLEKKIKNREKEFSNAISNKRGGLSSNIIDDNSEKIHNEIKDHLDNVDDFVNSNPKVIDKLNDMLIKASTLTYLGNYYNFETINRYMKLLVDINNNNEPLTMAFTRVTNKVLGVKKSSDSMLDNISDAVCVISKSISNDLKLTDKDLHNIYDPIVDVMKELLLDIYNVCNEIKDKARSQANNEDLQIYIDIIRNSAEFKANHNDNTTIIISSLTLNSVTYMVLTKNDTLIHKDEGSIQDRLDAIDSSVLKAGKDNNNSDNVVTYIPKEETDLTIDSVLKHIRQIIVGYNMLIDLMKLTEVTLIIPPINDTEYFNNASVINTVDIQNRLRIYMVNIAIHKRNLEFYKSKMSDVKKQNKNLSNNIDSMDECIKSISTNGNTVLLGTMLTDFQKVLTNYNNIEVNINKMMYKNLNKNSRAIDDMTSIENDLIKNVSLYVQTRINSL